MTVDPPAPVDPESLRRLYAEATPGEWVIDFASHKAYPQEIVSNDGGLTMVATTFTNPDVPPHNAALIVAMHAALPALIARVETLERAIVAWSVALDRHQELTDISAPALLIEHACSQHREAKNNLRALVGVSGSLVEPTPENT